MSNKFFATLIIMLLIAVCAPEAPGPIPITSALAPGEIPNFIPTVTPPGATPAVLDQMVDIGGRKLRLVCTGQGTPTVILEPDLGEPIVEGINWYYVRSAIEKTYRICVYERAALGSSDAPPAKPRTSFDMVDDLLALLIYADVPGPYVLVGHNVGGFNVLQYASQFPEQVAGIVLVDSMHPDYRTETLTVLPLETPDEPDSLRSTRLLLSEFVIDTPESMDLIASAEQIRRHTLPGDLPLVVITHSPDWRIPDLAPDVAEKIEEVWQRLQKDLIGLSSNSSHVIATGPGHEVPSELPQNEPELIIDAIHKVVEQAKR
jgi:pimeloyl-ACP methyl ester carboxylesterase